MALDQQLLEEINAKVHIVDLVSNYVELQKAGKNFKGLCPFHQEKTPSFIVSPEKNIAKCMGCGEGGKPITFYRKIKGLTLEKAAIELAESVGMKLDLNVRKNPYETIFQMMHETNEFFKFHLSHTEAGQKAMSYLESRTLKPETIKHFDIGLSPSSGDTLYQLLRDKGYDVNDMLTYGLVKQRDNGTYYDVMTQRITFPIKDHEGHIVGFSGRTLSHDESMKYVNSPESPIFKKSQLLYHLSDAMIAIRQHKAVILHEGFFDVIASYQAGLPYAVATMGTSLTKEHMPHIKKLTDHVILAYDGDKAGFEATNKAIKLFESEVMKMDVAYFPDGLDPDDYLKTKGIEAYQDVFLKYLKDPYDYRYIHYKSRTDFNVSNDRITFKDTILKMIQSSDVSIQSLYRKRLALDLGMDIEDLAITNKKQTTLPFEEVKTQSKVKNKYLMAEIGLIIGLIQNKKYVDLVKKTLSHQHFADQEMAMIRYQLFNYYEQYETFDLDEFLNIMNPMYIHVFEQYILVDIDYKHQLIKDRLSMEQYIEKIKESIQKRRLQKLMHDRKSKPENAPIYVGETMKIIKKLNGVKP
jgi:DNA primase